MNQPNARSRAFTPAKPGVAAEPIVAGHRSASSRSMKASLALLRHHGCRLAGLLLLLHSTPALESAEPAVNGPDRIAYSSIRPANWDIYYFSKPGEAPRRLTNDSGLEYDAVLSPDGRWAVFTSEVAGTPLLFALDLKSDHARPQLLIENSGPLMMTDQAAISADGKWLAFVSSQHGNADVFLLPFRPEQTQPLSDAVNLSHDPGGDFRPAFSPDGKHIAFSSDRNCVIAPHPAFPFCHQRDADLYVVDIDGKNLRQLTTAKGWDGSPVWAKDGGTIYYYSAGGEIRGRGKMAPTQRGGYRIWAINPDGTNAHRVSPENVEALSPTITPDGRIAFTTRSQDGYQAPWRIASIQPDGSDLRDESDTTNSYWSPHYAAAGGMICHGTGPAEKHPLCPFGGPLLSPGAPAQRRIGDRIAEIYPIRHHFPTAIHPTENRLLVFKPSREIVRIVEADLDGSNPRDAFTVGPPGPDRMITGMNWSKDGQWITYTVGAFFGATDGLSDVWKARRDGTEQVNLTANCPANDGLADFSGDGKKLVFRSGRSGNLDLYLMNADGTGVQPLTSDAARDNFPAFSPTENLIAFASDLDGETDAGGRKDFDIYTLSFDDQGKLGTRRRITTARGHDVHVQFSPDGKWLVFVSEMGGLNDEEPLIHETIFSPQMYGELYACRLSDGLLVRLTNDKWEDGAPNWAGPARQRGGGTTTSTVTANEPPKPADVTSR